MTARVGLVLWCVATTACSSGERDAIALTHGGSPTRGEGLISAYGCGSCHTIPGVAGAKSTVGPDLRGITGRAYIAGVLTNTPENMMRWLMNPPAVDDKTAMPNLHIGAKEARDMAAYLYTLR
ncbi:MAG TPA: c-type cytochrome [Gemmatimonadaceae bacterium]|nr:c-type cytochrome [Gemmatimonadaceae bacterium]